MLHIRLVQGKAALPLHRQISDQILFQIEHAEIMPGTRLPASRDLARELGVARGTIVLAYEELCSKGVCEGHVGRGTSVRAGSGTETRAAGPQDSAIARSSLQVPDEPVSLDPRVVSFLPSIADTEHLPVTELRRAFDRVLRFPRYLGAFSESAGDVRLRRLICEKILPDRGILADASEVMVVPGTQYGSALIALMLAATRKRIHFGSPGYLDFARNFARFGFEMKAHDVDAEGIRLAGRNLGPSDVLYVMPEHHFPQCVTLSDDRRALIERQVSDGGVLVVEDDYDSEYYYDRRPKPALKAGAASRSVIYVGTFSKTLFNSLRLGYLVANAEVVRQLATLHWGLSRGTSGLLQRWVAELLNDGVIERHVRRMRTIYRRKRDRIAEVMYRDFPEWRFNLPKGGLQFFIDVGDPQIVRSILALCAQQKLKVASPSNYVLGHERRSATFLVLGYGSVPLPQLLRALRDLKRRI